MMQQGKFDEFRNRLHPDLKQLSEEQLQVAFEMVREAWHVVIAKKAQAAMEAFHENEAVRVRDDRTGQVLKGTILSLNTKSVSVLVELGGFQHKWRVPPSWLEKVESAKRVA